MPVILAIVLFTGAYGELQFHNGQENLEASNSLQATARVVVDEYADRTPESM